jgi:hypothetical protein
MKNNIEEIFTKLHTCDNEEQVILNLKRIIKGFNVSSYKERLLSNPYFSSLVSDIKGDILEEINLVKRNIEDEIEIINKELANTTNHIDFNKLKELKRDCISLLYEVNDRINDLILL